MIRQVIRNKSFSSIYIQQAIFNQEQVMDFDFLKNLGLTIIRRIYWKSSFGIILQIDYFKNGDLIPVDSFTSGNTLASAEIDIPLPLDYDNIRWTITDGSGSNPVNYIIIDFESENGLVTIRP
jgi:hypothetical protein